MDIVKHFEKNLDKLTGANWVQLIQANDAFADKCDWSKLDGMDWVKLLKTHPQYKTKINFDEFYGLDWGNFLVKFPEYAHLCPENKRTYWVDFIAAHPDHPTLKDFDFSNIEEWEWDNLLKVQPKLIEKYPDFDDVKEEDILPHGWVLRVAAFPERFADRCPWDKLNGENLTQILSFQPQFADKCNFSTFDGSNWADLLSKRPEFAEKCPFEIFDGNNWETLLSNQPEFAERCDWEKLTGQNWSMLLHLYPEWAEKYNCPFEKFSSWDWAELLDHCPQFIDKCDITKLNGDELYIIFDHQPTLIREELIPQLKHRLLNFLCDYPEYISEYSRNIQPEAALQEIKELFSGDEYDIWSEVHICSMENAYIAKAVCVDTQEGKYRDIFFRDGDNIVQADADGKSITEALVKLLSLVRDCWRNDFLINFDTADVQ